MAPFTVAACFCLMLQILHKSISLTGKMHKRRGTCATRKLSLEVAPTTLAQRRRKQEIRHVVQRASVDDEGTFFFHSDLNYDLRT